MSEKTSQLIMVGELIFIVLPLSLLLVLFILASPGLSESFFLELLLTLLVLISSFALISGSILMITFIKSGSFELRYTEHYLWWFSALGAMLPIVGLIIAFIATVFSPYAKYQSGVPSEFGVLEVLGLLALASPLLIPFIHLLLERFLRKEEDD